MTTQLYNLDVPDEKADLNLKDADYKEILGVCHKSWETAFGAADLDAAKADGLYDTACRIMRPYAAGFPEVLCAADLADVKNACQQRMKKQIYRNDDWENATYRGDARYSLHSTTRMLDAVLYDGYFLSAVLNETDAKVMHVDDLGGKLQGIGYRLKDNKALALGEKCMADSPGERMQGGVLINTGAINGCAGMKATAGTFVNLGEMQGAQGFEAEGGTFINLRDGIELGPKTVKNAVIVGFERNRKEYGSFFSSSDFFWIDRTNLKNEKKGEAIMRYVIKDFKESGREMSKEDEEKALSGIGLGLNKSLDELEDLCLICGDSTMSSYRTFKSVENLSRKVDETVRADYGKRWY